MPLTYLSGPEIQPGDHVRYHGEPGRIEFLAKSGDPQTGWYFDQFGAGCMLVTPGFGRVFVNKPDEDLEFVSREKT